MRTYPAHSLNPYSNFGVEHRHAGYSYRTERGMFVRLVFLRLFVFKLGTRICGIAGQTGRPTATV